MKISRPTKKLYMGIWVVLIVLLFLTWGLAGLNLGKWNAAAALTIAFLKMLLVVLFFMHVRYGPRLVWVFVASGFFWLLIMIVLTMGDYLTR